jgi:hypothetical protein
MFGFLKRKVQAQEVAEGLFESVQGRASRVDRRMVPDQPQIGLEIINDEWIYFDVLMIDFATFLAFGETPARHVVLDPFSCLVANWLKTRQAPATPVRMGPYFMPEYAILAAEEIEPANKRLQRRLVLYAKAVAAPTNEPRSYNVAVTFSALCGAFADMAHTVGISKYFLGMTAGDSKMLKSLRIA